MYQTPARPSLLYTASVVLIDAPPKGRALPVLRVNNVVEPDLDLGFPQLDAVEKNELRLGQTFTVRGRRIRGDTTRLRLLHPRLQTPPSKFGRRGDGLRGTGKLPPCATSALPGTPEKIAVMGERAQQGFALFHPADAR